MTNQTELQEAVEGLKNRARHDEYTNGKDINVVLTALADAQMANRLIGNERDELLELRDQLCKERARDTSDLEQQARVIVRLEKERDKANELLNKLSKLAVHVGIDADGDSGFSLRVCCNGPTFREALERLNVTPSKTSSDSSNPPAPDTGRSSP